MEEVVRPTLVQTDELVPPRSVAREAAYAKLLSQILSAAEATQAARLHQELSPEQQPIMLSAGGLGTGASWTATQSTPKRLFTKMPNKAVWINVFVLTHKP